MIDDEEINRELLTRRLTYHGHVVLTADSGEAGLALAAREPVDLILLDVLMPGLSGYEVLSRIKADAILREIPVLMISALDQTASVTRCIALGADDYLTKPFDPLVLRARVSSCLRKKWARDFELAYLRGVEKVTAAALAVEAGSFTPDSLDEVGARSDALGNLARLFRRMGVEVAARERRLRAQVEQLVIAIDEERKAAQVAEITESDYFRELKARAKCWPPATPPAPAHRAESSPERRTHGQDHLRPLVSRRHRQVEPDREPRRLPRVRGKARRRRRHRHPVARHPRALRARRHERLADAQRLPVGTLRDPRGRDGRDARLGSGRRRPRLAGAVEHEGRRDREGAARGLRRRPAQRRLPGPRDHLALDYLLIDTHPGLNEETLLSIAISDVLVVLLRPDRQDFQGTAVTVEVARKLEVRDLLLVLNKVLPSVAAGSFIDDVSRTYDAPIVGVLPEAPEMLELGSSGLFRLRSPDHPLSLELRRVANRLE